MATNPDVPPPEPVEPLNTPPEPGEVQTTPMPMAHISSAQARYTDAGLLRQQKQQAQKHHVQKEHVH